MDKNRNLIGLIFGAILIAIGVLSLLGNFFISFNWDNFWPLIIVGVGVAFFIGMVLGGKSFGNLAVPGSILTIIGLTMLYMNFTDRWETWSYAWALIVCGVGAGVMINGYWSDRPDLQKRGLDTLLAGVSLFLIFGVLMEFIFSATGESRWGNLFLWAALLAVMGLYLFITRLLRSGKVEGERVDLFWPILMIGVGILAILVYLGWLPKENLWMMVNLWPLLLIVAGLGLLVRSRSPWVGATLGVLVVAVIFVVTFAGTQLGLKSEFYSPFDIGYIQIGGVSGESVIGSGNVIVEDRPVTGFDRVRMEIQGNLEIQQGTTEKLTISGEDNILPLLTTNVSYGELVIRFKPNVNIRTNRPIQITLIVKDLKGLQLSSSGNVTVKPITTSDFLLTLSSSGNVQIEGIQADKITAHLSSSGDIYIKGGARQLDLQVSSSGSFNAGDLRVQNATVGLSSSGDVIVWAVDKLDANISSSGNISYYGSPSVNQRITSSGNLIPKGEK
jgi:hypothetical protein